ncbi:MAG TPA: FAD-dependent oxidoreductase [Candidatus Aminicenantes bacterium]|nr:FAD-dependent oxidoreductase [Candidatus Aminicenantes bacterium]
MNAVIVGGGLAGTIAARTLRELRPDLRIAILGEERHPYYPRPNLIEYLAGRVPREKVFAFPEGWAARQGIEARLGAPAVRIVPGRRTVETAGGGAAPYDVLLLATGARASRPPVPGIDKKGVFVLRTLDDADELLARLGEGRRAVVLGGGLLGLEIARAVRQRGAEVEVVEIFDRLLPRQLDGAAAAILKAQMERSGVAVRLGEKTEEVLGDGQARGLRFGSGATLAAEAVIVAAGIAPETALARQAGLGVGRGVIVDDRLRTSAPGVYAAGDVAEHAGRIYGIIPAAFEQARAAAHNMLGLDKPYGGTVPSNTLKVAGLHVTSVGEVHAAGPGLESLVRSDAAAGLYKKIVLREGRLVGAIWMGTAKGAAEIGRLTALKKDVERRKEELLEENFDFGEVP